MLSIKENISNEIIIDKSKFITNIYKINNEDDINNYLNMVRGKYKDATHHCYAYILDDIKRFNDDKEPNGTAGKPILDVLEKNNLNHIMCIVTRYFGGIKLGAGGLVRAYSNSVSECLKKGEKIELIKGKRIEIVFNYDKQKNIDYILVNANIINKEYKEKIKYIVDIDNELLDRLSLESNIKILDEVYIEKIPI
jgi:uncharacterized YigZ family protein